MNEHVVIAGDLIGEYIDLRHQLEEFEAKVANISKEKFTNRMTEIEHILLDKLNAEGAQNIKSPHGTAMKVLHTSVTIHDGALFRDHVIEGKHWDLLDWRANKTAVKKLLQKQQPVPPGLNHTQRYVVNIRKAS